MGVRGQRAAIGSRIRRGALSSNLDVIENRAVGRRHVGVGKRVRRVVKIHTGKGANSQTDRYWGRGWYVWNNTGTPRR
jgi:hypothetical protein